jgi:hypothetical protein
LSAREAILRTGLSAVSLLPDGALRALSRALFSRSWARFEEATEHPRAHQQARLMLLLDRAKDTAFGKEHRFAEIRTLEDYRARVPVRGFDELEPYLARMTGGEANVLIPDRPSFFARTSGTTGSPKHIPVTDVYLAEYRTPRRVWMRQVMQAFPGLLRGKVLTIHSPRLEGRTADGTPIGSITVAMSRSLDPGQAPAAAFGMEAVPRRVYLLEDYETKYYLALRLAAQEKVTLAAAVNPSTLLLFAKKLDQFAERIAEDLERGTVSGLEAIADPAIQADVARAARRRPGQAARIRASKARFGRVLPTEVWPELLGLVSWKGGSAPFYLGQLAEWYPDRPVMDYGYLATEGGFSIPLSPEMGASGVVAVTGHVLEFIPEEARARGDPGPSLLADELEAGRRYRVVITGAHGLYRYDINDVVECTGRYRNTAEIAFVHKGGNMLSITGEKIGERHVIESADRARAATGLRLAGVCVAAELGDPPRYAFAVEAEGRLEAKDAAPLLSALEAALRAVNVEYAAKRDSERLGPPRLLLLRAGAFEEERRRRVAAGAPDSHVKVRHLVQDAAELEALGVVSVVG